MLWCINRLLPSPLKDAVEVSTWRRCYTMQEVNSALSKIQLVGYSQKIVSVNMILSDAWMFLIHPSAVWEDLLIPFLQPFSHWESCTSTRWKDRAIVIILHPPGWYWCSFLTLAFSIISQHSTDQHVMNQEKDISFYTFENTGYNFIDSGEVK